MRRVGTDIADEVELDLHGVGKHGYQGGNSSTGRKATQYPPEVANVHQEELANAIEGFGLTLDGANKAQLKTVLEKFVRHDANQSLTTPQKAQARSNIGAISSDDSITGNAATASAAQGGSALQLNTSGFDFFPFEYINSTSKFYWSKIGKLTTTSFISMLVDCKSDYKYHQHSVNIIKISCHDNFNISASNAKLLGSIEVSIAIDTDKNFWIKTNALWTQKNNIKVLNSDNVDVYINNHLRQEAQPPNSVVLIPGDVIDSIPIAGLTSAISKNDEITLLSGNFSNYAMPKPQTTNSAAIGYLNHVGNSNGASFTLPAGGTYLCWVYYSNGDGSKTLSRGPLIYTGGTVFIPSTVSSDFAYVIDVNYIKLSI